MERIPIKKNDIIWKNINGEVVLLNPGNGKYFGLNKVGCFFWENVDGQKKIEDIVDLLLDEYEVERDVLVRDIEALVKSLEENLLLSFYDRSCEVL